MTSHTLANDLIAALTEWGIKVDGADPLEVSLIRSGAVDSLALVLLSLWIEEKAGRPLSLATLDLATDWETPARIVRFVEASGRRPFHDWPVSRDRLPARFQGAGRRPPAPSLEPRYRSEPRVLRMEA